MVVTLSPARREPIPTLHCDPVLSMNQPRLLPNSLSNLGYANTKMVARSCQIVLRMLDEQVDTPRCRMRECVFVF